MSDLGLILSASDILARERRFFGGLLLNQNKTWRKEDLAALRVLAANNADIDRVSPVLGRDHKSIVGYARNLRITLPDNWAWVAGRRLVRRDGPQRKVSDIAYPYVVAPANNSHALMIKVASMVPKGLPEDLHADVCQDILLAVLEGDITEGQIKDAIPYYLKGAKKRYWMPWGMKNLDSPIFDDSSTKLSDTIEAGITLY